jgi:hypothetical protein
MKILCIFFIQLMTLFYLGQVITENLTKQNKLRLQIVDSKIVWNSSQFRIFRIWYGSVICHLIGLKANGVVHNSNGHLNSGQIYVQYSNGCWNNGPFVYGSILFLVNTRFLYISLHFFNEVMLCGHVTVTDGYRITHNYEHIITQQLISDMESLTDDLLVST